MVNILVCNNNYNHSININMQLNYLTYQFVITLQIANSKKNKKKYWIIKIHIHITNCS